MRKLQYCAKCMTFSGDQKALCVDIVRSVHIRTCGPPRPMRAADPAGFCFGYFWAVLSSEKLLTGIIFLVEPIGSFRLMLRPFPDPLYETTCFLHFACGACGPHSPHDVHSPVFPSLSHPFPPPLLAACGRLTPSR